MQSSRKRRLAVEIDVSTTSCWLGKGLILLLVGVNTLAGWGRCPFHQEGEVGGYSTGVHKTCETDTWPIPAMPEK
jgi:hypothetical protein